ncbi:MAG TPA: hypothetical protein VMW24_12385 [Sedimentisphaerales bacterium]|nr:hypothetical protein [Sedimentisphaerales bacterium]
MNNTIQQSRITYLSKSLIILLIFVTALTSKDQDWNMINSNKRMAEASKLKEYSQFGENKVWTPYVPADVRSYYYGAYYNVWVRPAGAGEDAWQQVFVYYHQGTPQGRSADMTIADNWANVDFSGSLEVRVSLLEGQNRLYQEKGLFEIRPLSDNVKAKRIDAQTLQFTLTRPGQYWVRLMDARRQPLFIFANPPEKDTPKLGGPGVIEVNPGTNYKAIFERAMQIPDDQPSILYFTPGLHFVGTVENKFRLKKASLYIPAGAVVFGVFNFTTSGQRPISDLSLRGRGIIDRGSPRLLWPKEANSFPPVTSLTPKEHYMNPMVEKKYNQNMLYAHSGERTYMEGLILINMRGFLVRIFTTNNHYDNVKLLGYATNADGFNCTTGSLTENCFTKVDDDVFKVYDGNTTIRNCVIWRQVSGGGVFIVRNMTHKHVKVARNILIEDIDIIWSDKGISSWHGRGLITVEGVNCDYGDFRFENWRINTDLDHFFAFDIGDWPVIGKCADTHRKTTEEWPMVQIRPDADKPSLMSNVLFKNIEFNGKCESEDGFFAGPTATISDVTFDTFKVNGRTFKSIKDFSPQNGFPHFYLVGANKDFKFIVDGKEYLEKNPMKNATEKVETWKGPVPYLVNR